LAASYTRTTSDDSILHFLLKLATSSADCATQINILSTAVIILRALQFEFKIQHKAILIRSFKIFLLNENSEVCFISLQQLIDLADIVDLAEEMVAVDVVGTKMGK